MRGLAEHHSLTFMATDQAVIFNESGVRTAFTTVMFNNFPTMNSKDGIEGKVYKVRVKSYSQ